VSDVYAILKRWCDNGEQDTDFARLDEIRKEFDMTSSSFARLADKGVSGHDRAGSKAHEAVERARDGGRETQPPAQLQSEDAAEVVRRLEAEIARLNSALRQRQEETDRASVKAESGKTLRDKAEAGQKALIGQNEDLLAQFQKIDEPVRADTNALNSARHRASEAEKALGKAQRQHAKLLSELDAQGDQLQRVQSRSTRADNELAQLAKLHINALGRMHELEAAVSSIDGYRARIREMEEGARRASDDQSKWLQDIFARLQRKPKLLDLLPSSPHQRSYADQIKASGLFDAESYLEKNPDVAAAGVDPLLHYICYGLREGRSW
jgi:DNA repair exonuclease SbcCD ATPase subunit